MCGVPGTAACLVALLLSQVEFMACQRQQSGSFKHWEAQLHWGSPAEGAQESGVGITVAGIGREAAWVCCGRRRGGCQWCRAHETAACTDCSASCSLNTPSATASLLLPFCHHHPQHRCTAPLAASPFQTYLHTSHVPLLASLSLPVEQGCCTSSPLAPSLCCMLLTWYIRCCPVEYSVQLLCS